IRGDVAPTKIGSRVNIQDLSLIHQSPGLPVTVEDDVTVGHQVTLHACTIRKNALIGMGTMVLDGAEIGQNAFIGAGSLVTPGTKIPENTLAFGRPNAKVFSGILVPGVTRLPAPMKAFWPISAPSKTIVPIPISAFFRIVQACKVT